MRLEFLDLPDNVTALERHLQRTLMAQIERFMLELGRGFMFVGSNYRIPVGADKDYADMVFYCKPLRAYVLIELKTTRLMASAVGQVNECFNYFAAEVNDEYDKNPIADNDSPLLSADRLEYTIGNGINYGFCTTGDARRFYDDLVVGTNEYGAGELMFEDVRVGEAFANVALACSKVYVSDEDRYAMQLLSEILSYAIENRIIDKDDLHSTEPEVIGKFLSDERTASLWNGFCAYRWTTSAPQPSATGCWRKVVAKKRYIDPMVQGKGRISGLSSPFADSLSAFQNSSQDYWICGHR